MSREGTFQTEFRKDLERVFPGCIVCKLDSSYQQGIPDLLMLWGKFWAIFEIKKSAHETPRPNQPYYVELLNDWSFAAFVFPENKEEVLDALQETFRVSR